jgi:hypothetical protein
MFCVELVFNPVIFWFEAHAVCRFASHLFALPKNVAYPYAFPGQKNKRPVRGMFAPKPSIYF